MFWSAGYWLWLARLIKPCISLPSSSFIHSFLPFTYQLTFLLERYPPMCVHSLLSRLSTYEKIEFPRLCFLDTFFITGTCGDLSWTLSGLSKYFLDTFRHRNPFVTPEHSLGSLEISGIYFLHPHISWAYFLALKTFPGHFLWRRKRLARLHDTFLGLQIFLGHMLIYIYIYISAGMTFPGHCFIAL